jgi:tetratricopeptide (TPR) repeat protein
MVKKTDTKSTILNHLKQIKCENLNIQMKLYRSLFFIRIEIFASVLLICLSGLFVSFNNSYTDNVQILHAENLLDTHPDSAYNILRSINQPEKLNKKNYAAWCLIYTHAQYKLQKEINPDGLINVAVDYYKASKYFKQRGTAYYLLGSVLNNHTRNEESIVALKEAESALNLTTDDKLKGLVTFNLGYVCLAENLYNPSLKYFKKSLTYFLADKNLKLAAYSYREISNIYNILKYPTDSVMNNLDTAIKLSKKEGDDRNYFYTLTRKGELLCDVNYQYSKECFLKGYQKYPEYKEYNAAYLAYIYSKLKMVDSAQYYLSISIANRPKNQYDVRCYYTAAQLAVDKNDYKSGYGYILKAIKLNDSIYNHNLKEQLYKLDKRYDLTKKNAENAALSISNRTKVIWITFLIILVLLIMIIFLFINKQFKKKQTYLELEKQRLMYEAETIMINNNNKRDLLLLRLTDKINNTLQFNKLKKSIIQSEKQSEFIEVITQQSIISEKEWQYYIEEVNKLFDNKIHQLQTDHSEITHADLIVISLTCLNVTISDACKLLDMSKNTMYTRRKTTKKRLNITEEIDLDDWIIGYLSAGKKDS